MRKQSQSSQISDQVSNNLLGSNDKKFHNQITTSSLIIGTGKQGSGLVLNKEDKNSRLVNSKKRDFKRGNESQDDISENYKTKDVPEAQLVQESNNNPHGLSIGVSSKSLARNESIETSSDAQL